MRSFLIGFTGAVLALLSISYLLPRGETVRLHTVDGEGRGYATVLWVVELPDGWHLRSGSPGSAWLERLAAQPLVELERGPGPRSFRAVRVEDAAVRQAVNLAMAEKYGLADRLVRAAVDVERSVPVRLEPIEGPGAAAFH